MENSEVRSVDSSQRVRVAVIVRPLTTSELLLGYTDCISVVHGEPQVQIGSDLFTFDHVYGSTGSPCSAFYDDCVSPLVDALFHGYNATVLAYGQTGSGKTYTMGTNYSGEGSNVGVIPKVMESIFKRVEVRKDSTEFSIRVSFIEIFNEEAFDLLKTALEKHAVPASDPIKIREKANGGIELVGVTKPKVRTKEEMATYLSHGSHFRATGSTKMNSQSSCSHAIFTITMEQKKVEDIGDDVLRAKLHLVDLAGSERAKGTGANDMRFKEGIHINKDLLAPGNVISALGDEKKRKGGHVPYRDSKLTRLLQDSLGGNSETVMIACVSPANTNFKETLNTLNFANRVRNIQNKAVINRDPMAAQMQSMRSQIKQLQAELLFYRGGMNAPFEENQILKQKISSLEASNAELRSELQDLKHALDAQKEWGRNEYEMHKLLALNQRQKMVLQRKTEEFSMATKRQKDLLESQKASSCETSGAGNGSGPGIQELCQAVGDANQEQNERLSSCARRLEMQMRSQNSASALKMRTAMDGDPNNGGHKYDLRKRVRRKQGYRSSFTLEDMDTSESEHSDKDDDWVVESKKEKSVKKRRNVDVSGDSCSCTRWSYCKTMTCPCRDSLRSCGTLCRCLPKKCANKGTFC